MEPTASAEAVAVTTAEAAVNLTFLVEGSGAGVLDDVGASAGGGGASVGSVLRESIPASAAGSRFGAAGGCGTFGRGRDSCSCCKRENYRGLRPVRLGERDGSFHGRNVSAH